MADLIMKISKMKYERPSAEQQKYLQTRQFLQFQKKGPKWKTFTRRNVELYE
jgi:hypothetical protein